MPDVAELGRKVKRKYPGAYDDLSDADLGRKVKKKYPGAYDDFTDAPAATGPSFIRRTGEAIKTGLAQAGQSYRESEAAILEAVGAAARRDLRPAKEFAELAGRGLIRTIGTYAPVSAGLGPAAAAQDTPIARLRAEREARRAADTADPQFKEYLGRVAQQGGEIEARAARDPSLAGRITRGVVRTGAEMLPIAGVGLATGGSLPAIAATTALQSAGQPETLPLNVALSVTPIPVGQAFRAGINSIRRAFGKGAAQVIEAEALPAATARVRESIGEAPPLSAEVPPATSLQSVFSKLETDNVEQIGAMIANANRRLGVKRTPAERQSSIEDYNRLKQLTREEHDALSQVLPPRTFSPVAEFAEGGYSREIRDIPTSERNAQLDANLRELEAFFGAEARAGRPAADLGVSAAAPSVRAAGASVTGPSASAPLDALNVAVSEAAESVPRSQRIKDELLGLLSLPKSLRSTLDISYPLRQGAILLLRPFQWRQSRKVITDMFRGFKTKNFEAINQAIETHPLAERMKTAGVDILEPGGGSLTGEEAFSRPAGAKIAEFVTQKAGKYVGIKQSDQAFTTAGNVQRVEAFQQYAKLIDKAGLSPEEALKADKAAAQWVNITTGRGGQRLAKAFPGAFELLNYFFFSPRYVASRLNVLNPAMYIKNAWSPGGRVVLRGQMGDLAQYLGVVGTTLYLAKQAGADVTLNPRSPDFGKIKMGTWRYDLGAGLSQALRASILIGEDLTKALRKQKPDHKRTAIDVGKTFLEYKLSPPAGVFRDLVERRTIDKKPFTYTGAARDLTVPMQWADFVEAYQKEAWGGVLKAVPGLVGVGAQNYESPPVQAAIEKSRPLLSELQRLDKRVSELRQKDGEAPDAFNARVQQFSANYTRFGQQLIASPRFQSAPDALKAIALDRLNERAKQMTHREFAFPEIELDANIIMDAAEQSKKNPANK